MANTTGKKYGGREKGTPNKLTKELRVILKDVIFNELSSLGQRMDSLEEKERIELMIKLIPYALPKIESVSHTANEPLDWDLP